MEPDKQPSQPPAQASAPMPAKAPAAPAQPQAAGKMPDKYIRTFAGDMDIFQKGGTPGLAPLKPTPGAVEVAAPAPAAAERPPMPIPDVVVAPPAPMPRVTGPVVKAGAPVLPDAPESLQSAAERLIGSSPIIEEKIVVEMPQPAPAPAPAPQPAPVKSEEPAPIETYAQDFSSRMQNTNASMATVIAQEQDAGAVPTPSEEPKAEASLSPLYIAGGVLLLALGGIGVYYTYNRYQTVTAPVVVTQTATLPIYVDNHAKVSGTGSTLAQAIAQLVSRSIPANTIEALDGAHTVGDVTAQAPGILVRNIDAQKSMVGIVSVGPSQSPFFIQSVTNYSATFSGMLQWEKTVLNDLAALYPQYPTPQPVAPIVATTTATSTKAVAATSTAKTVATTTPATLGFKDESVSNHDVRVYRDAQGRSVLMYGYWNQSTLIIARDSAAFAELLTRLATSHS